ncbi:hypothetical protein AY601_3531 [Pedobacter cryoconitis]|uniref:Uncharacterized protein n=1 Tax=Pedobacter cryoconitis TaxID=188932 RepID=A0A127VGC7_9SPHI|nr:hypothetical protein [Pedobacter cryoconitis]AMQ00397.1 hypothetical protein AY601_3531 [Pedobacter cryoconitis]
MEQINDISAFQCLKDQDFSKIKFGNFNLLIINNLLDQIVNENIEHKMISQIYMICYVFKNSIDTNQQYKIHLCSAESFNYSSMWKTDSQLPGFIDEFIYEESWENVDFTVYDFILCHPLYEKVVLDHIQENYLFEFLNGNNFPRLFSLVDTSSTDLIPVFLPYVTSLIDALYPSFDRNKLEGIAKFKKAVNTDYTGFDLPKQEEKFVDLIKNISITNINHPGHTFNRILLIDDHKRSFYIGDSCFWLQNININIKKVFPDGSITVICRDQRKINFFNKIFGLSLDENLSFKYAKWDDVNFRDYDIILYDSDLTIRFLSYVKENYESKFEGTPMFNYSNKNGNEIEWYSDLHYKLFFENRQPRTDLISNIKAAKSSSESEIKIQKQERLNAALWLRSHSVKKGEKIVVLIFNSSSPYKMLNPEIQIDLINNMALHTVAKILLFDEKGVGLMETLKNRLSSVAMDKIVVATQTGIRMDMSLLCDDAVIAIISPCTGMMHLANGIFRYLRKNKIIEKKNIPLMLVYTGNFMDFDIAYHPNNWWFNSQVKCAVLVKSDDGFELVKLNKVPSGYAEYNSISQPLKQMSVQHLFGFLKKNYPELSSGLFTEGFLNQRN